MKSFMNVKSVTTIVCGIVSFICIIIIASTFGVRNVDPKNKEEANNPSSDFYDGKVLDNIKGPINEEKALEISKQCIKIYFEDDIDSLNLEHNLNLKEGIGTEKDLFIINWLDIKTSQSKYVTSIRKDNGYIEQAMKVNYDKGNNIEVITSLGVENLVKSFLKRVYGISDYDNTNLVIEKDSHYGYKAKFENFKSKNTKVILGIDPYKGKIENIINIYE